MSVHRLLPLLLTLIVAPALAESARPSPGRYLSADAFDPRTILPPPPADDAPETRQDIERLLEIQRSRTPEQVALTQSFAEHSVFHFASVLGSGFTAARLPFTETFMQQVRADRGGISRQIKATWQRKRPPQLDPRIEPIVPVPPDSGYPSEHAVQAYLWGGLLAEAFPEYRIPLLERAAELAWTRVIGGVHLPGDVAAGRLLAEQLIPAFMNNPEVREALREVRRECAAAGIVPAKAWPATYTEIGRFRANEARQGVAVDARHVYAITNRNIGKYDKVTGARVSAWEGSTAGPFIHLNAGIVLDDLLYCAHSNYPGVPIAGSVEIWDPATMRHVGSHSFGNFVGSLTWIDRKDGNWYAGFVHYANRGAEPGRDPAWSQVVEFDDQWRRLRAWLFPAGLVARFDAYGSSGGAFGPGGYLYAAGHDKKELYVLDFPAAGSVLEWIGTIPFSSEGQAFAWDPVDPSILYSINRSTREVVFGRVTPLPEDATAAFELSEATVDDIHAAFRSGRLTARALVEQYLRRIEAYDKQGPALNTIMNLNPQALAEADRLDAAFAATGALQGPLHGIPVLVKDQIEATGMPTTYGSAVFQDFVSHRDATVVTRLRAAGAIILGKTTMGEYAARYAGSAFGIVRNAYNPERNPSGSSGGSGAAIAANFATLALGEDTGGSVRGPASAGSLVGLRPSVPLVSRHGMLPWTPSHDTIGPMARTVRDTARLLDVIAGYDANDPVTAAATGHTALSYTIFLDAAGLRGARIGVIRQPMDVNVDPAAPEYLKVRAVIDRACADLRRLGAVLVDPLEIPDLIENQRRVYLDNKHETEAAIDRYLAELVDPPVRTLRAITESGKVVPFRNRQMQGVLGLTTEDPDYLQVLLHKAAFQWQVLQLMADHGLDALVYATSDYPQTPVTEAALTDERLDDNYGIGNNRRFSPALGFPALTVPAGFTPDGMPVGLEFMGRPFAEGTLFRLGYAYEQGTRHRRPPPATP